VDAAPIRGRLLGRSFALALTSVALASIDDHPDRPVTLEVLLEIVRELFVSARDDEQEAIRCTRQNRT
jgi:hypothetical protein